MAGIFYDEPEIGNLSHHDFHALPGQRFMSMPWSDEMPGLLSAVLGKDYPRFLPLLWYDGSAAAKETADSVRYEYMNLITRLIENNYSRQMYLWCREHGLMYIGHVLEDENSHGRLGCGCGHFFRVEHYQDMAGVDVISEQIIPGATSVNAVNGCSWVADGEFYHYGLAKLASSNAHINPLMKDQSFCEILALYGMTAGPKLRKYIVDHMVVAGINHFIVMQGSFPGNPYFPFGGEIYSPYYIMLHHYTNRLCHLMSGGRRQIPAAILYHGEAEWSGEAMLFQKAARVLAENQLDYDIISGDYLMSSVVESGCIHVNDAVFRLLIVPGTSRLPGKFMGKMKALAGDGAHIWFLDQCPTDYCDYGCTMETAFEGPVVLLDALEKTLHEQPWLFDISLTEKCEALRYCLTVYNDMECLMLHNQEAFLPISPQILLPERWNNPQQVTLADLAGQKLERPGKRLSRMPSGRLTFKADLGQWESAVLVYGGDLSGMDMPTAYKVMDKKVLENSWHLSFKPYIDDGENVYKDLVLDHPKDLAGLKDYRKFAGEITYTTEFDIQLPQGCQKVSLSVNDVYESVTVIFNGHLIGRAFAEKYRFHLPCDYFLEHNVLELKVQNSMARGVNDGFIKSSKYMPLEPSGLTGNVTLLFEEECEES